MSERITCRVERARVRPSQRDTLDDLIYMLFERRHHNLVAGTETDWLTVELVQSLRRQSEVYRAELSTETSGPLPFALGFFRVREGSLELTTDRIPANMDPESFVLFLSEFVEPGARVWFGPEGEEEGWEIRGVNEVISLTEDRGSTGKD